MCFCQASMTQATWMCFQCCVLISLFLSLPRSYLLLQILVIISLGFSDGLPLQFPGFYLYLASSGLRKIQNIRKLFSRFSPVRLLLWTCFAEFDCWLQHWIAMSLPCAGLIFLLKIIWNNCQMKVYCEFPWILNVVIWRNISTSNFY